MLLTWPQTTHLILFTLWSFLHSHPLRAFYCAAISQSLALHYSEKLSLAIFLMSSIIFPENALRLMALGSVCILSQNKLYVKHDNPLPLLCSILISFFGINYFFIFYPWAMSLSFALCNFICHVQASLVWHARHEILKSYLKSPRTFAQILGLCLLILLSPLSYIPGILGSIWIIQIGVPFIPLFGEQLIILSCLLLFPMGHWNSSLSFPLTLMICSLISAYKGLYYDICSCPTSAQAQRAQNRIKHSYRSLPLIQKLSSPRLR